LAPTLFINQRSLSVPEHAKFLSPTLQHMFQVKQEDTHQIFKKIIPYNVNYVKSLLNKIKKKNIALTVIGYGGLNINVFYFIYHLAEKVDIKNLFEMLAVYENEHITLSNMFRIYTYNPRQEYYHAEPLNKVDAMMSPHQSKVLSENFITIYDYFSETISSSSNMIFFGAPDFPTRQLLENRRFIFGGHQNNEAILYKTPVVNENLTHETYGTINLSDFFFNIFELSVRFIDLLATRDIDDIEDNSLITKIDVTSRIKEDCEKLEELSTSNYNVYQHKKEKFKILL
jgi:hypothetical protein